MNPVNNSLFTGKIKKIMFDYQKIKQKGTMYTQKAYGNAHVSYY